MNVYKSDFLLVYLSQGLTNFGILKKYSTTLVQRFVFKSRTKVSLN